MTNQLIFVPEIFFREERKAIQSGGKMQSEFERGFAKHARVGPGEPIEHLRKSVREMATRSSSTSTIAAMMDERVEFATRQSPELWDSVLRQAEYDRGASLGTRQPMKHLHQDVSSVVAVQLSPKN